MTHIFFITAGMTLGLMMIGLMPNRRSQPDFDAPTNQKAKGESWNPLI